MRGSRNIADSFTFYSLKVSTLLEEKVLYRTLKGSISAMYLKPLKGYIHS